MLLGVSSWRGVVTTAAMLGIFISSSRGRGGRRVAAWSVAKATTYSNRSNTAFRKSSPAAAFSTLKQQMTCAATATATLEAVDKTVGIEHPAYDLLSKDYVAEYGAAATLYRHKKSGAELLSVSTDDDNKVFGITFRTPRTFLLVCRVVSSSSVVWSFLSFLCSFSNGIGLYSTLHYSCFLFLSYFFLFPNQNLTEPTLTLHSTPICNSGRFDGSAPYLGTFGVVWIAQIHYQGSVCPITSREFANVSQCLYVS